MGFDLAVEVFDGLVGFGALHPIVGDLLEDRAEVRRQGGGGDDEFRGVLAALQCGDARSDLVIGEWGGSGGEVFHGDLFVGHAGVDEGADVGVEVHQKSGVMGSGFEVRAAMPAAPMARMVSFMVGG